jgi:hypothetical protein
MERNQITAFAERIGFRVERFVDGMTPVLEGHALGQSWCVLTR